MKAPFTHLQWPGYCSSEAQSFAGTHLKETEPREGIGVVGYFLVNSSGKHWLYRGDYIVKDDNGDFFYFDKYEFEKLKK